MGRVCAEFYQCATRASHWELLVSPNGNIAVAASIIPAATRQKTQLTGCFLRFVAKHFRLSCGEIKVTAR